MVISLQNRIPITLFIRAHQPNLCTPNNTNSLARCGYAEQDIQSPYHLPAHNTYCTENCNVGNIYRRLSTLACAIFKTESNVLRCIYTTICCRQFEAMECLETLKYITTGSKLFAGKQHGILRKCPCKFIKFSVSYLTIRPL